MKPESLHALIIDRHFGELSPEAEELLEHHLAAHASARAEAERIVKSLNVARDAVLRHPELGSVPVAQAVVAAPRSSFMMPRLARAAVLALFAAVTGIIGFVVGRSESQIASDEGKSSASVRRKESPWARYRLSFDPSGEGMQVVRVDTDNLKTQSIP